MSQRKRIAFIRPGKWPLANEEVAAQIEKQFPDCEVDVVDIKPLILSHPGIVAVNLAWIVLLYGMDIVFGHKKLKEAFWYTPYIFRQIKRLLAKQLPASNYMFSFQMQSLFDCSLPGVPHFVYTDHTHLANLQYPGFPPRKLYPQKWIGLEKQIYHNARITFVRSTNIRQSLIEQYELPPERAICVYAGNNVSIANSAIKQKNYTDKRILFVGIDWIRKGGPELVAAFQDVLTQHPDARLIVVGASPEIHVPNCTVVGRIPPAALTRYYEEATIFCMPTHIEPFGIAFLEAMQARLPIVATNVGAIPDFVQDGWNGYLVKPGDIKGIANALSRLLSDSEHRQVFGERGFALAQERYSWKAVGERFQQHICKNIG